MPSSERYFHINIPLQSDANKLHRGIGFRPIIEKKADLRKNFLTSFQLHIPDRLFFTGIPNEEQYITSSHQYLDQMESGLRNLNEYEEFYITPDPIKQENLPDTFKNMGLTLAVRYVSEDNYMIKLVDPTNMHYSSYALYSFNLHRNKNHIRITSGVQNMRTDFFNRFITFMAPIEQAFSQSIANIYKQKVLRELKTNRKSTRIYNIIGPTLGYVKLGLNDDNYYMWEKYFYPNP